MLAVLEVLSFLVKQGSRDRGDFIQLCVDSQLVVTLITNKWVAQAKTLADIV